MDYDILLGELRALQIEILSSFKDTIGCEFADILWVHSPSRELLLLNKEKWLRIPMQDSILGECITSGESLHIPNAYADDRFNKFEIY